MTKFILYITVLCSLLSAKQVGKFNLLDSPEDLHRKDLELPQGIVAMSEFVKMSNSSSEVHVSQEASSIFFIIDNSRSMFETRYGGYDTEGARYLATMDIIDSIHKHSPNTEVGLSVFSTHLFFDPNDNSLFQEVDTYNSSSILGRDKFKLKGGFIPLVKLNEATGKGKYPTETGYETLKRYLAVESYRRPNRHYNLTYQPSENDLEAGSTNIWSGFSAAKEAMLESTQDLSRQYVIFFSDGANTKDLSSGPKGKDWKKYAYPNCPTSFTVFFNTEDKKTTEDLQEFTDSVASNNYSVTNKISDMWAITAGREKLVDTLMTNVIDEIIKTTSTIIPSKISIQGQGSTNMWNGTDSSFTFGNLFPLTGESTKMSYTIDYSIVKDSIGSDGSVVKSDTIDSNKARLEYYAVLKDNPNPLVSYNEMWWDRTLKGYENNSEVTFINTPKGDLEIRFEEKEVDTLYGYRDIKVVVTSQNGDKETFDLERTGNKFSITVPRSVGSRRVGDKQIQTDEIDTITLSFANPKLPLDTISYKIPVDAVIIEATLSKVVYYDRDANGLVDEILFTMNGDSIAKDIIELISEDLLPKERDFSINRVSKQDNDILVEVTERGDITTATQDYDRVKQSDTIMLSGGSFILPFDLKIVDSIAPILISASLEDSVKVGATDILTVTYSEDIKNIFSFSPLTFYKNGYGSSNLELKPKTYSNNIVLFEVIGNSSIVDNDSVNIFNKDPQCEDKKGVKQSNIDNKKVPLEVRKISDGLQIDRAENFDKNGDGKVDLIVLTLNRELDGGDISKLVENLTLSEEREYSNILASIEDKKINIWLTEKSITLNTALYPGESVELTDSIVLNDTVNLVPSFAIVTDSVAPLIMNASYHKYSSNADSLYVTFSESIINGGSTAPFNFIDSMGSNGYSLTLKSSAINNNVVTYEVLSGVVAYKDSITIVPVTNNIEDSNSIIQQKDTRYIEVEYHVTIEHQVLSATYFDRSDRADGYIDEIILTFSGIVDTALVDSLTQSISLPNSRYFTALSSHQIDERTVSILGFQNEDSLTQPNTALEIDESITLSQVSSTIDTLTNIIVSGDMVVIDSLAPVIVRANYLPMEDEVDSSDLIDTIKILFSEEIEALGQGVKFSLYDESRGVEIDFITSSAIGDSIVELLVVNQEPLPESDGSDSISIIAYSGVSDKGGVAQDVNSVRVPLYVKPYKYNFDITVFPNPYNLSNTGYVNPLIEKYGDGTQPLNRIAIMIKPKGKRRLEGVLSASMLVFDNVGNRVYSGYENDFKSQAGSDVIINAMDARNTNGRELGAGAYIAVITVKLEGNITEKVQQRVLIGISK